jgi:tetratricopeptide (TPR) repeat protein
LKPADARARLFYYPATMANRSKKAGAKEKTSATIHPLQNGLSANWLPGLALLIAVVLTYTPVWHAGFIWDDDLHVTANPAIIGPLGVKEIWTTSAAQYYPLVLTTFWVEHALWGLQPLPYHLVNVLMHGGCAILLWRVLLNLRVPGAWLGAALWALHPVQVETAAWVSELKNTQSGLFYLLSILFFVKAKRIPGGGNQHLPRWGDGLVWLFAALAMASKSSTVVLPAVLCLCAWWMEGQWRWRNLARVAPVILMALASAVLAMWTVKLQGVDPEERSWPERVSTAGDVVWFYLGKLLWPHPLIFIYPRWNIDASQGLGYLAALAAIVLLGVLWFTRGSWGRPYFFALAYFLVALFPVLGLVNHYFLRYSFVADHLQYLASMGPLALAGAGISILSNRFWAGSRWLKTSLAAGLLLILALLSWQRAWAYESQERLWTDTLAKNPNCWMAENNLGNIDFRRGEVDEAIGHYHKALAISPIFPEIYDNLGVALSAKGQTADAMANFQKALELDPGLASAHDHLGNTLLQEGQVDAAIDQFQEAVKINPYLMRAEFNLGNAFLQQQRLDDAIAQYRKVLEIDPNFAEALSNLGLALAQNGQLGEAIVDLQRAVVLDPDFAQAHNNLGLALAQNGEMNAALAQFQEAVRLKPDYLAAQNNLERALSILNQDR